MGSLMLNDKTVHELCETSSALAGMLCREILIFLFYDPYLRHLDVAAVQTFGLKVDIV